MSTQPNGTSRDCPKCGHSWHAHHSRNQPPHCVYRAYADYKCPCDQPNPITEAEDRAAARMWNAYMGRAL